MVLPAIHPLSHELTLGRTHFRRIDFDSNLESRQGGNLFILLTLQT